MTDSTDTTVAPTIDALRGPSGTFAMLAIDQRESLRAMIAAGSPTATATDQDLVDFKTTASRLLTPYATAVLLDRAYGLPAAAVAACPVILAADILHQEPGGPVTGASLDEGVNPELVSSVGAAALKMLVPWLPDARDEAIALSAAFMDLCRAAGVPGIVEGVVRPADIASWSDERRDAALVQAAKDLAVTGPDLYKAEIPSYGRGPATVITEVSARITNVLDCPWVVLSSGVTADDFPAAVAACLDGGAEGFLAGRAVWADALRADETDAFLAAESTARLRALTAVVTR
ncbi:aldolase [Microbacterium sp. PRC9]|uniref:aldolase n=1 Tax=Microbacterium sp. PRC9 TaxID=2962591 RepID=UPI0028812F92|nr:aldolase [Microbacterium sp. PRC9]MDT0143159.1 aldolase [Microbacterium sp. PRC9]